jgi:hypothetical protein
VCVWIEIIDVCGFVGVFGFVAVGTKAVLLRVVQELHALVVTAGWSNRRV